MSTPQLVWFKRDLRLHDHAPLAEAARHGPLVLLWVWEPSLIDRHDADLRHLRFQHASLVELERDIAERGGQLLVRVGELPEVLTTLGLDRFTLEERREPQRRVVGGQVLEEHLRGVGGHVCNGPHIQTEWINVHLRHPPAGAADPQRGDGR